MNSRVLLLGSAIDITGKHIIPVIQVKTYAFRTDSTRQISIKIFSAKNKTPKKFSNSTKKFHFAYNKDGIFRQAKYAHFVRK